MSDDDVTLFGDAEVEDAPAPRAGVRWGGVTEVPAPREKAEAAPLSSSEGAVPSRIAEVVPRSVGDKRRATLPPMRARGRETFAILSEPRGRFVSFLLLAATVGALFGIALVRGLSALKAAEDVPSGNSVDSGPLVLHSPQLERSVSSVAAAPLASTSEPSEVSAGSEKKAEIRPALKALKEGRCAAAVMLMEREPLSEKEREFAALAKKMCSGAERERLP